jgi:hypothetical protein
MPVPPHSNEIVPNPDPSAITITTIDRAIANVKQELNTRIDGMQKAIDVFNDNLTRVPTQLDRAIDALRQLIEARLLGSDKELKELHINIDRRREEIKTATQTLQDLLTGKIDALRDVTSEKFSGVRSQFEERDTRTDQRAGDTKLAVDAAFAAAKEATSKIETGFTKQIDAMNETINVKTQNAEDKIVDLKDRVTAIEANRMATDPAITNTVNQLSEVVTGLSARNNQVQGAKDHTASLIALIAVALAAAAFLLPHFH